MKKRKKSWGPQARAMLIFRRIQKIKQDELNKISMELQKKLDDLFNELAKNKELDPETANALRNLFGEKNEVHSAEETFKYATDYIVNKLRAYEVDGVSKILLHLTPDGDLYKNPKNKYCYSLTKSAQRLKIIRFLIGRKDFISGKDIAEALGKKYASITFAISKINSTSKHLLGLPENEPLIISRNHGGYRLNPLYPINEKEL